MTLPIGNVPQVPFQIASGGLRTEYGTFMPPGGRVVAYVHHLGQSRLADITAATTVPNVCKTLNEALRQCQPGWGDTIYVLPGHSEDITVADQMSGLVAGTRIIGLGTGNLRPVFRWTVAAASFLLDQQNVLLSNLRLQMDPGAGTVNVAAPMTVSASGCTIDSCDIRMGSDSNSKVTIGITTTSAADDTTISNNFIYSVLSSVGVTTCIRIIGGNRMRMVGNNIQAGTSSVSVGVVQMLTTAPLQAYIVGNVFGNMFTNSTVAFTGITSAGGVVKDCLACINSASAGAQGFNPIGNLAMGGDVFIQQYGGGTAAEVYPGIP